MAPKLNHKRINKKRSDESMRTLRRITGIRDNLNTVLSLIVHDSGGNINQHLNNAWAELNVIYEEFDEGRTKIEAGMA